MATNFLTPNMNLLVPVVGAELAPTWASDLNVSLATIDSHNHAPGNGVLINPAGININADLTWNNTNNAVGLRSTRFYPQASAIASASPDTACVYVSAIGGSGNELFYNDSAGNQVQITKNGSIVGAAGTITGLPSGTAGESYSGGTFTFVESTGIGASLDAGPYILRYQGSYPSPSGNYIVLAAPASLSGGYQLTLPTTIASIGNSFLTSSNGGQIYYTALDDNTLNITGTTIQVKPLGITNAQIANQTITATQIANQTITATQIANNTISGAQINVGVALQGNLVTVGLNAVITSNSPTQPTLAMIRGTVSSGGSITSGEGFTVSGGGNPYTITFTNSFSDLPAISVIFGVSVPGGSTLLPSYTSLSGSGFTVQSNGATHPNGPFAFIAIGAR